MVPGPTTYGNSNIVLSEEEEMLMNKIETRLAKNKQDFESSQRPKGRPSVLNQINIDRVLSDERSLSAMPTLVQEAPQQI